MLLAKARLCLLNSAVPITREIGKVHAPFAHRLIQDGHVHDAEAKLKPGQALVAHTRGELTNMFIPGDFSHAAIYVGVHTIKVGDVVTRCPLVVEAVSPVVRVVSLASFLLTKDKVLALTPLFVDEAGMRYAADQALMNVGIPYDFLFEPGKKAFYCAELVYDAYSATLGVSMPFTLRETLGVATVIPQDFVDAVKYWRTDWDSSLVEKTEIRVLTAA